MLRLSLCLAFLASSATAFMPLSLTPARLSSSSRQIGLRGGCGLKMAENALESVLKEVKSVKGVKSVQRVVCGGCLDFKVVTALSADAWGDWEGKKFAPEEAFLAKVKGIKGVSQVETQTYTLMPM